MIATWIIRWRMKSDNLQVFLKIGVMIACRNWTFQLLVTLDNTFAYARSVGNVYYDLHHKQIVDCDLVKDLHTMGGRR
jgi:hypothetical protein